MAAGGPLTHSARAVSGVFVVHRGAAPRSRLMADGGGTEQAHRGARGVGLEHVAVLPETVVLDMEEPVLNAPVPATEAQHPCGRRLRGGEAGHQIADAGAGLPRGQPGHLGGDLRDLTQPRQGTVAGQRVGDAHLPALAAAVPLAHPDRSGRRAIGGEEEHGVGEEGALVFLSRST